MTTQTKTIPLKHECSHLRLNRVYRIDFNDGYYYIGRTSLSIKQRMSVHLSAAKSNKQYISPIQHKLKSNPYTTTILHEDEYRNTIRKEQEVIKEHELDSMCLNIQHRANEYKPQMILNKDYKDNNDCND